jgi:hypothetical protein
MHIAPLCHFPCGFWWADGRIEAKHRKVLIGNSGHSVESVELLELELVFMLASTATPL